MVKSLTNEPNVTSVTPKVQELTPQLCIVVPAAPAFTILRVAVPLPATTFLLNVIPIPVSTVTSLSLTSGL